jgi:hypothetical protein
MSKGKIKLRLSFLIPAWSIPIHYIYKSTRGEKTSVKELFEEYPGRKFGLYF